MCECNIHKIICFGGKRWGVELYSHEYFDSDVLPCAPAGGIMLMEWQISMKTSCILAASVVREKIFFSCKKNKDDKVVRMLEAMLSKSRDFYIPEALSAHKAIHTILFYPAFSKLCNYTRRGKEKPQIRWKQVCCLPGLPSNKSPRFFLKNCTHLFSCLAPPPLIGIGWLFW